MRLKVKDVPAKPQKFVYIELSEEEACELKAEVGALEMTRQVEDDSVLIDLLDLLADNGYGFSE